MNENHKSIDSYFESARKQRTVFTKDKAAGILEKGELINKPSFFSKKGVKIMTASAVLIVAMIGSLSLGVFDKSPDEPKHGKQAITISKEIESEPKEIENISEVSKGEKPQKIKATTSMELTEQNDMIIGMNSIMLTEDELKGLGICYGSERDSLTEIPTIQYWGRCTPKAAFLEIISKKYFMSRTEKFPSTKEINYLRFQPLLITQFDGTKRLSSKYEHPSDYLIELNDFMPFHQNITTFISLDFKQNDLPDKLPFVVLKNLRDLNELFKQYLLQETTDKNLYTKIDEKLEELIEYFKKISTTNKTTAQNNNDSNNISMTIYDENPDDSSNIAYTKTMSELGVKVIFEKPRIMMKSYLENNFKDIEERLTLLNTQIENYIMANKLIAIKIPFKNDLNNDGLIFWFHPTSQFIDYLPERFRYQLTKEFKLIENNEPYCGAPIDIEKAYLDVWRTCSGAIENLRIFPNPVKDILNLKFELKENREIFFVVHDLSGRKIRDVSQKEQFSTGTITVSLNLGDLSKGMYYIVAKSKNNEQVMQRFIKE